jgi:type IV pilus assembly protein PilO
MTKVYFKELNLENFHQWPYALKYSLLIFFAILLGILNYWLIFNSKFHQYKIRVNEEINLREEFENKHRLANVPAYQNQLYRIEKIYRNNLKLLVRENEISNLLNEISQMGLSSGLVFKYFSPKIEEKNSSKKEDIINIEVIGEYQKLALFFSKISNYNRLVTLDDFEIIKEYFGEIKRNCMIKNNNLLRMRIMAKIYHKSRFLK